MCCHPEHIILELSSEHISLNCHPERVRPSLRGSASRGTLCFPPCFGLSSRAHHPRTVIPSECDRACEGARVEGPCVSLRVSDCHPKHIILELSSEHVSLNCHPERSDAERSEAERSRGTLRCLRPPPTIHCHPRASATELARKRESRDLAFPCAVFAHVLAPTDPLSSRAQSRDLAFPHSNNPGPNPDSITHFGAACHPAFPSGAIQSICLHSVREAYFYEAHLVRGNSRPLASTDGVAHPDRNQH